MDYITRRLETLHIGNDWNRSYTINGNIDLSTFNPVCKIRDIEDNLIIEADCTIQGNTVYVSIPSAKSLTIPKHIQEGLYDLFITDNTHSIKLVMGIIKIIHDISLH